MAETCSQQQKAKANSCSCRNRQIPTFGPGRDLQMAGSSVYQTVPVVVTVRDGYWAGEIGPCKLLQMADEADKDVCVYQKNKSHFGNIWAYRVHTFSIWPFF
jgi:hypothetical protein